MYAHLVDTACLAVMLLGPLPFAWWLRFRGAWIGALVVWAAGILAGRLISILDPARENGMLDAVWLLVGLPVGLHTAWH